MGQTAACLLVAREIFVLERSVASEHFVQVLPLLLLLINFHFVRHNAWMIVPGVELVSDLLKVALLVMSLIVMGVKFNNQNPQRVYSKSPNYRKIRRKKGRRWVFNKAQNPCIMAKGSEGRQDTQDMRQAWG